MEQRENKRSLILKEPGSFYNHIHSLLPGLAITFTDSLEIVSINPPAFVEHLFRDTPDRVKHHLSEIFAASSIDELKMEREHAAERQEPFFRQYIIETAGRPALIFIAELIMERNLRSNHCLKGVIVESSCSPDYAQALRESEQKYRTLIDLFPQAVAIFQDDRAAFVNDAAARILGFETAADILGVDVLMPVPDYEKERLQQYMIKHIQGDRDAPSHFYANLLRKDGHEFPVEIFASSTMYNGRPALMIIFHDISERERTRRALSDSENSFRRLVEGVNAIIYTTRLDNRGTTLYISPRIEQMIGFSAEEIISDPDFWLKHLHPDDLANFKKRFEKPRRSGQSYSFEYRMFSKDNRMVWIRDEGNVVWEEASGYFILNGFKLDVTQSRLMERSLQASERRFRELAELLPQVIFEVDNQFIVQYVNHAGKKLLGFSESDIVGRMNGLNMIAPEDRQRALNHGRDRLAGQSGFPEEFTIVTGDGNSFPVIIHTSPIFSGNQVAGLRGIITDITAQKEMEKVQTMLFQISEATSTTSNLGELLRIIREKLGILVDTTNFQIAFWDREKGSYSFPYSIGDGPDGSVINNSPAALLDHVRISGQPLLADQAACRKIVGSETPDQNLPTSWLGAPLKTDNKILGVVALHSASPGLAYTENDLRFLTIASGQIAMAIERKKVQDTLKKSEEFSRAVIEYSPLGVSVRSNTGKLLSCNRAWQRIWGRTDEEVAVNMVAARRELRFDGRDRYLAQWLPAVEKIYKQGGYLFVPEVRLLNKNDNDTHWVSQHFYAILGKDGKVDRIVILTEDITKRKLAEEALRESEERYRILWENSPIGICMNDRQGIYHFVNSAYCRIYGYTKEELLGRPFYDLIMPPGHPKANAESFARLFDENKPGTLGETDYYINKNGEPVCIQYTYDFVRQGGVTQFIVTMNIDITEKKRAVDALRESEEKYRLVVDNAGEVIVRVDYTGRFLLANRSAARFMGTSPESLIGKTMWDLFPKHIADRQVENIRKVVDDRQPILTEDEVIIRGESRWFKSNLQPVVNPDGGITSAIVITNDITAQHYVKLRDEARFQVLQALRRTRDIDTCLELGCIAIYNAQLFRRAVLTLHNSQRQIINLGQIGVDSEVIEAARQAPALTREMAAQITQNKYRISLSYFIPKETGVITNDIPRRVSQPDTDHNDHQEWKSGDELFTPIIDSEGNYEGWLSVDTPFNGRRPTLEIVLCLEEILDIVSKKIHEIKTLEVLKSEGQALQDKNIALREVLSHIEEEKMEIKNKIGANVAQVLLPALNKLVRKDGTVNPTYYNLLKIGLPELITASGAMVHQYARLSPREREICNMIKAGSSTKEMADTLNISPATVQKHRELIRRKLGINNKQVNLANYLKSL